MASLNSQTRNEGPVIKVIEFHPKMSVALVAGSSGTASIFQVYHRWNVLIYCKRKFGIS